MITQKWIYLQNELKKYLKVMNELEEQNFGSLLKRIISKCDLNALLFEEMISNGKLEENRSDYTQESAN